MRLFVVEPLAVGGMIHYAYQLCTALAEAGVDVTLVTAGNYEMDDWPHNFTVEKRIHWWTLHDAASSRPPQNRLERAWRKIRWSARRAARGVRLLGEWLRLTRYLLQERPDAVQFGKINFPFEAFFLAWLRFRGLCLTQICHEFELRERGSAPAAYLANRLYTAVYAQFSLIFLHGESNRRRFLQLFPQPEGKTAVIPHGNERIFAEQHGGEAVREKLRRQYRLADGEPVILFFGNLTPSKGLPELLRAFARARCQAPARLIVAGYPTKYINLPILRETAVNLGIADSVVFDARYIPIAEVGPLMELATVVAYPYLSSTQSGSLQVAYSFGRPVVATAVGGLPDVVEDGRSGFLVPPANPEALGEALGKIISSPALAQEMGAYARHLSQTRFAWGPIGAQIIAIYQQNV